MCRLFALGSVLLIAVLLGTIGAGDAKKLPPYVTPCKRLDPNLSKCYIKAIHDLKPYLRKGIPEFGIPSCDPLVIPKVVLSQPPGNAVGFDATLTNLTFEGGLDCEVKDFKADLNTGYFYMELYFPRLVMLSDYVANGKVLIVNFEGEGKAHGDFGNITLFASWDTEKVKKNGKEHFKVVKDHSTLSVSTIQVEFENLFKGNKAISDNTNKLINENSDILYTEIKPIIERTVIDLVTGVVNFVNNRYSIDDLYPL